MNDANGFNEDGHYHIKKREEPNDEKGKETRGEDGLHHIGRGKWSNKNLQEAAISKTYDNKVNNDNKEINDNKNEPNKKIYWYELSDKVDSVIKKKKKKKEKSQNKYKNKLTKIEEPRISIDQILEEHEPRSSNVIAEHLKVERNAILKNGTIHFYNESKGFYEPQSVENLKQAIMDMLGKDEKLVISYSEIKEALNLVPCDGRLNRNFDEIMHPNLVNCLNGVVDVKNNTLIEHSPKYCFTYCINAEFEENPVDKNFSKYIRDLTLGKTEVEKLLCEWTGYLISDISSAKKAAIIYGPSDSGKSLYSALLTELIGEDNVSNIGLDKFNNPVYLAQIMNKKANIVNELSSAPIKDFSGFKQLTSDLDTVVSKKLYNDPKKQKCTTKLQFCTNHLPILAPNPGENLDAYFNRLLIIPFDYVIDKENIDRELYKKLIVEKNAIFMWAIKGLKRYLKNNDFSYCEVSEKILAIYKIQYNPVHEFIKDNLILDESSSLRIHELYGELKQFGKLHNIEKISKDHKNVMKNEITKIFGVPYERFRKDGSPSRWGFKKINFSTVSN